MPLIISSTPPERCLGALPNLYPPHCPSYMGLGIGASKKSDAFDAKTSPASCQEAPLTAPPWSRLRAGKGLLHIPAALLLNGKHSRVSGIGTVWVLISAPSFINRHQKGRLLSLLAPQFTYLLNNGNRTISWDCEDYMQQWAGIQRLNKWSYHYYY